MRESKRGLVRDIFIMLSNSDIALRVAVLYGILLLLTNLKTKL
jgi:hypothetical protein